MALALGVGAANWLGSGDPDAAARYARAAEEAGFDFVTLIDHVALATPALDGAPRSMYVPWTPIEDPMVSLGLLAGVTRRVRLRTCITLAPLRGPAVLAKQVATADYLSGGRVDLGMGVGWHRPEYDAAGVPFDERGALLDEGLEAMRRLWDHSSAEFTGRRFRLEGLAMEPKPAQRPHPPLWFGGTAAAAFRRTVAWGCGWIAGVWSSVEEVARGIAGVRAAAARAGRGPGTIRYQAAVPLRRRTTCSRALRQARALLAVGATDLVFLTSALEAPLDVGVHLAALDRLRDDVVPALRHDDVPARGPDGRG